jgi:signal transduction histidine kinase
VRHLVYAQGGEIWADSEGEGKGATFSFTLPAADVREQGTGDRGQGAGDRGQQYGVPFLP